MEISRFNRTLCPVTPAMTLQFVYTELQKAAQISYGLDLTHQQSVKTPASSQELKTQVKIAVGPGAGMKTLLSPPILCQVLFFFFASVLNACFWRQNHRETDLDSGDTEG